MLSVTQPPEGVPRRIFWPLNPRPAANHEEFRIRQDRTKPHRSANRLQLSRFLFDFQEAEQFPWSPIALFYSILFMNA